ncbi:spore germination protein [Heliorestis convoluta]|uniref:GerA spore germination protein n=1 Tax=Heliorestis convoluta TaxID=356322 RepID=A0A5Q2N5G9_9FIRM|nr:spore germination protein [Heliorestis convoluta]QGG47825.1 GerA spore germination protein [Heliorestis convoluta]
MSSLNWKKLIKSFLSIKKPPIDKSFSLKPTPPLKKSPLEEPEDVTSLYKPQEKPTPFPDQKNQEDQESGVIPNNLSSVRHWLDQEFLLSLNDDVMVRPLSIGLPYSVPALLVYFHSQVSTEHLSTMLIHPLTMEVTPPASSPETATLLDLLACKVTTAPGETLITQDKKTIVERLINGHVILFVEGQEKALVIEGITVPGRAISPPTIESTARGPQESFVEDLDTNIGLVRARLRTPRLVCEIRVVGRLARTRYCLVYIAGLTNPALVKEMRKRIQSIDVDTVHDLGLFEQYLEDQSNSLVPQHVITERPDRVTAALSDGSMAVLLDRSPYGLVAPITLWNFIHSPEDMYLRTPFGNFIRLLRLFSVIITLFAPALYMAVQAYHPEMLPTELMLATAGAREQVPFPVFIEILFLELSLELIREASLRVPQQVGPTIGIVGAIIIGQAAVEAGLVSPILVVIMAITALASFSLPTYTFFYSIRILRLILLVGAAFLGLYGLAIVALLLAFHLAGVKSLGVPLLSPLTPKRPFGDDFIFRGPISYQNKRPLSLRSLDKFRENQWRPPRSRIGKIKLRRTL